MNALGSSPPPRECDVAVIGGGILGAGIAAVASRHGLSVALVDRGDFGGATSGASSKLVHGGLRYLRLGDVGLVRESHQERRILMRVVAPHLVRRQPFLFPFYRGGPYRPWVVQSGIVVYQALARSRVSLSAARADCMSAYSAWSTYGLGDEHALSHVASVDG